MVSLCNDRNRANAAWASPPAKPSAQVRLASCASAPASSLAQPGVGSLWSSSPIQYSRPCCRSAIAAQPSGPAGANTQRRRHRAARCPLGLLQGHCGTAVAPSVLRASVSGGDEASGLRLRLCCTSPSEVLQWFASQFQPCVKKRENWQPVGFEADLRCQWRRRAHLAVFSGVTLTLHGSETTSIKPVA